MVGMGAGRALVRAVLPSYLMSGWSGARILRQARRMGWGYRESVFYADVREYQGFMVHEAAVRGTPSDLPVARGNMTEVDIRRARRYRYFADVEYTDARTGATDTRLASMYDDENLSEGELERKFIEQESWRQYQPEMEVTKVTRRHVQHHRDWSY